MPSISLVRDLLLILSWIGCVNYYNDIANIDSYNFIQTKFCQRKKMHQPKCTHGIKNRFFLFSEVSLPYSASIASDDYRYCLQLF